MPGRVVIVPGSGAGPTLGPGSLEDQPAPAARRYIRGAPVNGHQGERTSHGLVDVDDGGLYSGVQTKSRFHAGTDSASHLERYHYPGKNILTSISPQGLPTDLMSTLRPQSAMAFTSNSYNKELRQKILEASSATRQFAGDRSYGFLHYDDDLTLHSHQRSHSYGDGVTLAGHAENAGSHVVERSVDVYATVARRQAHTTKTDTIGRDCLSPTYEHRQQSKINGAHIFTSEHTHGIDHNKVQNHGQDNPAFIPDVQTGETFPRENLGSNLSRPASTSLDLRSAWQRLYGNSSDISFSRHRPSLGEIISPTRTPTLEDSVRHQSTRQQTDHLTSPGFAQTHQPSPHDTVQTVVNPVISLGHDSSQDGEYLPSNTSHYGNSSQHAQLTTVRESPTGQSSSNPDHTSGSNNSSQLSSYSASNKNLTTFKPQKKKADANLDPAIGPASKYPETQTGRRSSVQTPVGLCGHHRNGGDSDNRTRGSRHTLSSPNVLSKPASTSRQRNSSTSEASEFQFPESLAHPSSKLSYAFLDSDDSFGDEYSLRPHDSIFDYPKEGDEGDRKTPLSTHSPTPGTRRLGNSLPTNMSPGFSHKNVPRISPRESLPKTPDLLRPSSTAGRTITSPTGGATMRQTEKSLRSHLHIPIRDDKRVRGEQDGIKFSSKKNSRNSARSRSLDDVRESETDSVLSFDIENTILTVEPSDQSEMGTVSSYKGSSSVKAQLNRLEGMYTHMIKALGDNSHGPHARRRWSIGSSDTSSLRHHTHQTRHSRVATHRLPSKDVKVIGKRFQRLESHVITLARSVAHLSSELRAHNSLSREIDNVKREMQELKSQSSAAPAISGQRARGNRLLTEFERYQGWVPSLTNPRRVNKLTKFFGQEPPLLEIFLKQLGYEKFLKNFEDEHIGMIELPYMTEDRLQSIGIPMGPRLRILQEAQLHFQEGNFDFYFV